MEVSIIQKQAPKMEAVTRKIVLLYPQAMSQTMSQSGGSTVSDNQSEQEEQKYPMKFEWKEGGNEVYLTGSFCNWEHQFQMNFNPTSHNYELLLYLPKGLYEFKFIVDNKWRYSSFIPNRIDNNGNNNNYIDNTDHPSEKENKKHKRETIPRNSSKIGVVKEVEYNRMYPKKGELNEEAPNVPMIYIKQLNGSDTSTCELESCDNEMQERGRRLMSI